MATEIERKFLVVSDAWKQRAGDGIAMRQGYLLGSEKSSVRVRVAGDEASLNIKSATLGVTRAEFDYNIPVEDANELLATLCDRPLVEKVRYHVTHGEHVWDVDVFSGENAGLIVAEIELTEQNEAFQKPAWAGDEVSDDPRYYNVCLVRHPYRSWGGKR
ncbi:MAG: adenylate cyclase [Gammaproteobacteria bacterium]|nr:MAG: adenylate cyclase [Gammaproteobacteria bacterium]TND07013.1 MAG: adenylate cyclase [Gammaproteobacteria bacterium]